MGFRKNDFGDIVPVDEYLDLLSHQKKTEKSLCEITNQMNELVERMVMLEKQLKSRKSTQKTQEKTEIKELNETKQDGVSLKERQNDVNLCYLKSLNSKQEGMIKSLQRRSLCGNISNFCQSRRRSRNPFQRQFEKKRRRF